MLPINSINTSTIKLAMPKTAKASSTVADDKVREQHKEVCSSAASSALSAQFKAGLQIPQKQTNVTATAIKGLDAHVVKKTTAEEGDNWWKEEMNYDNPPYLPKSDVVEIQLDDTTTFSRVYDNETSGMYGGWVMKSSDIEGLTPAQIKDKFALPSQPTMVCDVVLEKGTKLRAGICNPLEGWGKGGGLQFDLIGQRTGSFGNERPL